MAPRQRDYKAEYAQRIERGKVRGLTISQAAGHPKEGEKSVTQIKIEATGAAAPTPPKASAADQKAQDKGYASEKDRRERFNFIRDRLESYGLDRNTTEHRQAKAAMRHAMDELAAKKKAGLDEHLSTGSFAQLKAKLGEYMTPGQIWGTIRSLYRK